MDNCNSEKICIQAKKVFDACQKQVTLSQVSVNISDIQPINAVVPLTFVSSRSTSTTGDVNNLVVDRLPDRPNYGRVQADVEVPVEITYLDNANVEGKGQGFVTVPIDVVMYLPEPSIIPYKIESSVSAVSPDGHYSSEQTIGDVTYYTFNVDCCATVIIKLTMDVELIIPSYGYAVIPPCQEYTDQTCNEYFELPLYPNGKN